MKIVRHTQINNEFNTPVLLDGSAFFDIETTGFSRDYCTIYMIGAMHYDVSSMDAEIVLFFAETPAEEASVIVDFFDWLSEHAITQLITFNGERFDIPFVSARIEKLGLDASILCFKKYSHLDIYREISPLCSLLGLKNRKQKSIEAFLGIDREDEMNGGQLISVYKRYVIDKNDDDRHLLIIHNYEDVLGMLKLLPVLSYSAIFNGTAINPEDVQVEIDDSSLNFAVTMSYAVPITICYTHPDYMIRLELKDNTLKLTIPIYDGMLRYYYTDYKNYCYLPLEGYSVHKSIGMSVDKNSREPATPATCFTLVKYSKSNADKLFRHYIEILI